MKTKRYRNVTSYRDRHGKLRYRFRRAGSPTYSFRSKFGTPAFEAELEEARNATETSARAHKAQLQATRRRPPKLEKGPCTYVVGPRYGGPVKIGYTVDLPGRLVRLQTAHPRKLAVLRVIPGGPENEKALHRHFAAARFRGEWFFRTREMADFIRGFGEPHLANPAKNSGQSL